MPPPQPSTQPTPPPHSTINSSGLSHLGPFLSATSRSETSDSLTDHSSYLSALRQIDSIPVPDLASTLNNPAAAVADEADEANISFLRTPIDPQDEWRAQNAAGAQQNHNNDMSTGGSGSGSGTSARMAEHRNITNEDRSRRERLQRVLARLNRDHERAYGDRIPNHNSLYDWSPAGVDPADEEAELREYIADLRRQQPNTHPEVLRVLAQTQLDGERERRQRAQSRLVRNSSDGSSQTESSLRSSALLQAVRRHPRFNARSRENMQRYILDRERYIRDNDPREPHPTRGLLPPIRPSESGGGGPSAYDPNPRQRLRRAMLLDPTVDASQAWLQDTLRYLGNLRDSTSYEDSLDYAVEAGFDSKDYSAHHDFLMDLDQLPRIAETSLLAGGATFEGIQQADSDVDGRYDPWRDHSPMPSASRLNSLPPPEYIYPGQQWSSPRRSISPQYYDAASGGYLRRTYNHPKEWPVKAILHAIDYERMTLSATMVAYDVPPPSQSSVPLHPSGTPSNPHSELSHLLHPPACPHPPSTTSTSNTATSTAYTQQKSIKTYVEGELIDFRTHTLLTESYKSTPLTDITYWRKLAPFRHIASDEELARKLVSRKFLAEEVLGKWVLMRWKERCFVDPRPVPAGGGGAGVGGGGEVMFAPLSQPHESYPSLSSGGPGATGGGSGADAGDMGNSYGLTISGFYYICMRRSDGFIEGLYCDPVSAPYQYIKLERRRDGWVWPAWEFK